MAHPGCWEVHSCIEDKTDEGAYIKNGGRVYIRSDYIEGACVGDANIDPHLWGASGKSWQFADKYGWPYLLFLGDIQVTCLTHSTHSDGIICCPYRFEQIFLICSICSFIYCIFYVIFIMYDIFVLSILDPLICSNAFGNNTNSF